MLVVEIPLVSAAEARSTRGAQALTAIGIGMSILVGGQLAGPGDRRPGGHRVGPTSALAIASLHVGRRSRRHGGAVRLYHTTGLGRRSSSVRLDATVAAALSAFLTGLALNSLGVAIRGHQHGGLIRQHATDPIVWATPVRLAVTAAVAWIGVRLMPQRGPLNAGSALTVGAFLEAAALQAPTRRLRAKQPQPVDDHGWMSLITSHGNLSAGRLLVMAPTIITTFGVAHATRAPESLVVWPVLIQFAALFTSPTTDWESVAANALRADRRSPDPQRLTGWLAAGATAAFALCLAGGLADRFVRDLLAVPDPAGDLGLRWAWLVLPLLAAWLARGYLRGAVMAEDHAMDLPVCRSDARRRPGGRPGRPRAHHRAGCRPRRHRTRRRRADRCLHNVGRHGQEPLRLRSARTALTPQVGRNRTLAMSHTKWRGKIRLVIIRRAEAGWTAG
jgi:hypothetical protein